MIKILSIGNSFSQDAHRYLQKIAHNEGMELECVNLFIGGCSLETHWKNLVSGDAAYALERNGDSTQEFISISQALIYDNWDYVTLQQASHYSIDYSTYSPYLQELAAAVRRLAHKAKLFIHQTWAYEQDSKRLNEELGFRDQHEMLDAIRSAYNQATKDAAADGIIPSGEAMMYALDAGVRKVHRDTYHAGSGLGRYLLGLTWYITLTGQIPQAKVPELDEEADLEELQLALQAACKATAYRQ